MHKLITILGPTASGKTNLAVHLAAQIDGEIISADSRQVYKGMDIGTGKDLDEYTLKGTNIPYHLIDIKEAGTEYNVFQFQQDFIDVFKDIVKRGKTPILCGGTGFYLSAALDKYQMIAVPENKELREVYASKSMEELVKKLTSLKDLHNSTDLTNRERVTRSIEIEIHKTKHPLAPLMPEAKHYVFGIEIEREIVKEKISNRLKNRLDNGMIKEVENLLSKGVSAKQLKLYGLEYRFITEFIEGDLSFNDMYQKLNTAIHVFAKKQMTWFRKMERNQTKINWIKTDLPIKEKLRKILDVVND
jgi:tRNA dimethylallyltransferase